MEKKSTRLDKPALELVKKKATVLIETWKLAPKHFTYNKKIKIIYQKNINYLPLISI